MGAGCGDRSNVKVQMVDNERRIKWKRTCKQGAYRASECRETLNVCQGCSLTTVSSTLNLEPETLSLKPKT